MTEERKGRLECKNPQTAHVNREEAWRKDARCGRRKDWSGQIQGRKEAERRPAGVLKDRDLEGWEQSRATEFSIRSKDIALLFHCFPLS